MSEKKFSATAYISEDSEFSLAGVFTKLSAKYSRSESVSVQFEDPDVKVDFGNWCLTISSADHLETPDLSAFGKIPIPVGLDLSTSGRVQIIGIDPYPNLDHFNDFLIVCERVCDAYDGVFVRDDSSGRWV